MHYGFFPERINTLGVSYPNWHIQPGPSMTFLVYSDPSKTVYSDPPNHFVRITINRFRRITINQEHHWWSRLYVLHFEQIMQWLSVIARTHSFGTNIDTINWKLSRGRASKKTASSTRAIINLHVAKVICTIYMYCVKIWQFFTPKQVNIWKFVK